MHHYSPISDLALKMYFAMSPFWHFSHPSRRYTYCLRVPWFGLFVCKRCRRGTVTAVCRQGRVFCVRGTRKHHRSRMEKCEADQRLCFRYTDSTIPLLKSEISSIIACFCDCTGWFVSRQVGNTIGLKWNYR